MRNSPPRKPHDDLAELRRLLVRPEQEELRGLQERLDDKEQRAHEIADVLPEAVTLTSERTEDLTRALRPAVEGSVRESVAKRPQFLIDALHPIIGSLVRKSIAESMRNLLQSLNQSLEQSFSWQGLKWRFEALRTGRSFAEVVMLRSLVYRVEQLFLIHRETSLSLLHLNADGDSKQDPDMLAGMLSAIQDFTRDSFKTGQDEGLDEFRVGELQVWIAPGQYAYLAAVIRGNPPRELRTCLDDAIDSIHILRGSALAKFEGDATEFESLRAELEPCLRAQYQAKKKSTNHHRAWFALATGAALVVAALIVGVQRERHWRDFVRRLNSAPGIAVTQAENHWFTRSWVAGLRDPAVADPAALARAAGVNPNRLRFEWKDYLALDDQSVLRRFVKRFGKPNETSLTLKNGALMISGPVPYEWFTRVERDALQSAGITSITEQDITITYDPTQVLARFRAQYPPPPELKPAVSNGTLFLSGTAPYEWLAPVRKGATKLPGIAKISEHLQVAYDPQLVLQRFVDQYNLPDSVNARVEKNVLVLAGEAPHAWRMRVRHGAPTLPGIRTIDEHNLTDLDQRTYQQSKSVIESAFVYFLLNKDNFATEGFAALSRLPDEIRRCLSAASRLGLEVQIEVRGYADAVGSEAKNIELSQRRADAVKDFLVKCGFDPSLFQAMGLGAPPMTGEPQPEQSERRVALMVVPKT
ncbi:MAG TPA: OmpA family protein [Chthoniobacterales bacterium]|jgi:OOP family OmpA-OmpF porin|nr:OmpA family protein [Chthoniobacterales bacterium]